MNEANIEPSWKSVLAAEFKKDYWKQLNNFIAQEKGEVFPSEENIFTAYNLCPFNKVKVVILGQDPYHSTSTVNNKVVPTSHGLCFSVVRGAKIPPSLKNIFKEIKCEYPEFEIPEHGNLESWAKQGILMINATLTVRAHEAMSHSKMGWEEFTNATIQKISEERENVVFILWGNHARTKKLLINQNKHLVLETTHPSPFSARNGFLGCNHFKLTNEHLEKIGKEPIDWINLT